MNLAIGDKIEHGWSRAFAQFVQRFRFDGVGLQERRGASRGVDLEAHRPQVARDFDRVFFVAIAHGNEHIAFNGQVHARSHLRLGKRNRKRTIRAHDFAR